MIRVTGYSMDFLFILVLNAKLTNRANANDAPSNESNTQRHTLKSIALASSILLVLAGLVHVTMTGQNYAPQSPEALWYIGSGILLIGSGLYSFTSIRSCDRDGLIGAGLISIAGVVLSIMSIRSIDGVHTYILLALFVICLIGIIYRLIPRQS